MTLAGTAVCRVDRRAVARLARWAQDSPARRWRIERHAAIVVGAGPAGLAVSRELARAGIEHAVLERGDRIGHSWANLYDSLVLHTGKHLSRLPGMPFPRSTPLFPTRLDLLKYLERYAEAYRLPIRTSAAVTRVDRDVRGWHLRTAAGDGMAADTLVVATGIVSNPHVPAIEGRERFRGWCGHSVEYRRPASFAGKQVLIVGAGNSAGEIAAELASAGAAVTVSVRSGARAVPRQLLGLPIQYLASILAALPRGAQRTIAAAVARVAEAARGPAMLPPPPAERCVEVPLIGFHLVDALRAGAVRMTPGVLELTASGARFTDGSEGKYDAVIMATGYRPALGLLAGHVTLDACGFARRTDRVTSADSPDLYFVGHNYDLRGALFNIAWDARLVARRVARDRAKRWRHDPGTGRPAALPRTPSVRPPAAGDAGRTSG